MKSSFFLPFSFLIDAPSGRSRPSLEGLWDMPAFVLLLLHVSHARDVWCPQAALPRITGAVLGNESGDLDSVACALVMARFLPEPQLPVLNFPRADLALHTEVMAVME
jgi:hypothetical protein